MSRDDFRSIKVRETTHASSTALARKHRTSNATIVAAAVERFLKLPPATILKDIELHDPRSAQPLAG